MYSPTSIYTYIRVYIVVTINKFLQPELLSSIAGTTIAATINSIVHHTNKYIPKFTHTISKTGSNVKSTNIPRKSCHSLLTAPPSYTMTYDNFVNPRSRDHKRLRLEITPPASNSHAIVSNLTNTIRHKYNWVFLERNWSFWFTSYLDFDLNVLHACKFRYRKFVLSVLRH